MNANKKSIVVGLAIIAVIVLGVRAYYGAHQKVYLSISEDVISEQESRLAKLAHSLDTWTQTPQARVINDCAVDARYRFDELLSNLSSLQRAELVELNNLFEGCAYYHTTVQQVGVTTLEREITVYKDQLRMVSVFDTTLEKKLESIPDWNELVRMETERSQLHSSLVKVQADIIINLLAYETTDGPAVKTLVAQGQEIRENITWLDQQIDALRVQLLAS